MHSPFAKLAPAFLLLLAAVAHSQTTYKENFTGANTALSWYFFNGACLTGGSSTGTTSPGPVPACTSLPYYANKGDAKQVGGITGLLPDDLTKGGGALRFTNGFPYGYNENGAIVSNFTFPAANGLQVTFTTETYAGNSGGGGADGADGMSFFLQSTDQGQLPDLGAFGGSLGYTCSNNNNDGTLRPSGQPRGFDGLIGGYIGLGIDEYGNYLNPSDNTSTGPGYQWNRIGLRGAGSTAWTYLQQTYPAQYPITLSFAQRADAVQKACSTGVVWDFSQPTPVATATTLPNYAAIPNAYKVLNSVQIANEAATMRGDGSQTSTAYGVPITYNLKIVPYTDITVTPPKQENLLSLSYSYNGGTFQPIITAQDIIAANGKLPTNVRFGFAGSSGGSTNIHEILCFQAAPSDQTSSSAGVSQKQSAKVQTGTQVYFAYYNTDNWQGAVTSSYLINDTANPGNLIISPAANWDASCVLTGVATSATCASTGVAGPTAAQTPASRIMLTWDGTKGIPFEWNSLATTPIDQQAALAFGDKSPPTPNPRLAYLRGDRSNELSPLGVGLFRTRTSVLGDIINSSPSWVGPPNVSYLTPWHDAITSASMPENSGGAQSYAAFTTAMQTRTNVVYVGSNDGFLHGFRSGAYTASKTYDGTNNDGQEVLAYMPGYVLNNINASTNTALDFSNPQYSHKFSVDATPATGDVFYGNSWHTLLIGGLGAGGNVIYALDVTDPSKWKNENTAVGAKTVIGEWNTTLNCVNDSATPCGTNLGNTYGTPQIRRFHNGQWGAVFGNGYGSTSGDAGIYVMLLNPSSGTPTFYYYGTGKSGSTDGIGYTTAVDLDGDAVVDYVYAGDLLGNVWRFDLTSNNPNSWSANSQPLFTTPGNQPITTQVISVGINSAYGAAPRMLIEFGTGRQMPFTLSSPATYATNQQSLYGIWDWNFASWNTKGSQQWDSLPSGGVNAPSSALTDANLQQQTITGSFNASLAAAGNAFRTVSANAVCYADGGVACAGSAAKYGWYLDLPVAPADPKNASSPKVAEQLLFTPALLSGVFTVNTSIPPTSTLQTCSTTLATSWFMGLNPETGGAMPQPYLLDVHHNPIVATTISGTVGVSGEANLGIGSPSEVIGLNASGVANQHYIVLSPDKLTGGSGITPTNPGSNTTVRRITWIQKR